MKSLVLFLNDDLGVKIPFWGVLKDRSKVFIRIDYSHLFIMYLDHSGFSTWYNRNGWLGVKHQVTYLQVTVVSKMSSATNVVSRSIWRRRPSVGCSPNLLPFSNTRQTSASLWNRLALMVGWFGHYAICCLSHCWSVCMCVSACTYMCLMLEHFDENHFQLIPRH